MPLHDDIVNLKVFGSAPADVADFSDTIVDDLSDTGWGASYSPPGTDRPEREGFNTQFRRLTRLGVELRQSGAGLEWDARVVYHRDAIVRYINILYVALQMNSNQTPSTSTAHWRVLQDGRFIPQDSIPLNRMVDGTAGEILQYNSSGVLSTTTQQTGGQGSPGENGWSPVFAVVTDGERRVLQVDDWVGGQGTKPTIGQYVGSSGLVNSIGNGVDIRGPNSTPVGWGETPTDVGVDDALWVYTQPDYRNSVQGTRISLAGYSNVNLHGLSIDGSTMYVLDDTNDEIALFSLSGVFQSVIDVSPASIFGLQGLDVSNGMIYVIGDNGDEVGVFTTSGTYQSTINLPDLGSSTGLAVKDGLLYIAVSANPDDTVVVYNQSAVLQRTIPIPTVSVTGIAISGSLMFIVDSNTDQVHILDLNGNEQGSFNLPSTGSFEGISVSGETLYVLDDTSTNGSVLPYTTTGEVVTALGQRVSGSWERREFGIG